MKWMVLLYFMIKIILFYNNDYIFPFHSHLKENFPVIQCWDGEREKEMDSITVQYKYNCYVLQ